MSELSCYEAGILVQMDTRVLVSDLSSKETQHTQRGAAATKIDRGSRMEDREYTTEDRGWKIEDRQEGFDTEPQI
jgi:hypothetical protein